MRILLVSAGALALDQLTKTLTRLFMELGESIPVLGNVVRLTYIENPGIAFGIRVSSMALVTTLSIVASGVIVYYMIRYRREGFTVQLPLALILGGAVGNLIDRLLYGRVVDFIDIGIGDARWPAFNIADSSVTIGIVMFLYTTFLRRPQVLRES